MHKFVNEYAPTFITNVIELNEKQAREKKEWPVAACLYVEHGCTSFDGVPALVGQSKAALFKRFGSSNSPTVAKLLQHIRTHDPDNEAVFVLIFDNAHVESVVLRRHFKKQH